MCRNVLLGVAIRGSLESFNFELARVECSHSIQEIPTTPHNTQCLLKSHSACSANEACPLYPEKTTRLHVSFPDPSGKSLAAWATVRDGLKQFAEKIVQGIVDGKKLAAEDITVVVTLDE